MAGGGRAKGDGLDVVEGNETTVDKDEGAGSGTEVVVVEDLVGALELGLKSGDIVELEPCLLYAGEKRLLGESFDVSDDTCVTVLGGLALEERVCIE